MKREDYAKVIEFINSLVSCLSMNKLGATFPYLSPKSLGSIYSQLIQQRMKRIHHYHNSPEQIEKLFFQYRERVLKGEVDVILKIAVEIGLAPALLARMMVDRYVCIELKSETVHRKLMLSELLRDTSLIADPVLAANVDVCHLTDDVYGPLVDNIKHVTGLEYEIILQRQLDFNNIAYSTQEQMRARGYDKTPDFKLDVPIIVDNVVINWIESKASFGDDESNACYLKDQFWSYWNRFGSGLVIYWFGFIDDLNSIEGILIKDHFPTNIMKLNPVIPKLTAPLTAL